MVVWSLGALTSEALKTTWALMACKQSAGLGSKATRKSEAGRTRAPKRPHKHHEDPNMVCSIWYGFQDMAYGIWYSTV